ncbi:MAG: NAD(P)H-hydrate dehydratase [Clostridia bacterium]|nr:NAD(P)H-hydrate dehydratase [Clostridia bacterium]
MMLVTPEQMKEIDRRAIEDIGIPGVILMENAALWVVEEINKMLGGLKGKRILIAAGKGNNGGDGFAAARHLHNSGADVKVFLLAEKQTIKGDAAINLAVLFNMGIEVIEVLADAQLRQLKKQCISADLIVDTIFGTGFKGEVKGTIKKAIEIINASGKAVLSVDMPSGADGYNGKVCGSCIKADMTVSFVLPKLGQVVHPACEYAGKLKVADIGIPKKVLEGMNIKNTLIDREQVSRLMPSRFSESNKGDYGKILIISGSTGMTGAGCLAASAALRTGAGLVYLGVPSKLSSIYDAALLESVTVPLEDEGKGCLSKDSIRKILDMLGRVNVAALGPGLSVSDDIEGIVAAVIENSEIPLILDADALNAVSRDISMLGRLKSEAVITPHPGEMSRLMGISTQEVQNNRIDAALEFAMKWNVNVVLKGSRTVVALPDGSFHINPTGNPGMATAGTGDVLAGIISSLAGQGLKPSDAAIAGVYIHGMAGDVAAAKKGEHGMIASDVVNEIPAIVKKLVKDK